MSDLTRPPPGPSHGDCDPCGQPGEQTTEREREPMQPIDREANQRRGAQSEDQTSADEQRGRLTIAASAPGRR
jgi:hypothetical protein